MSALRLIFLGPPGTGKGTQAARLSQRDSMTALSSGDALRREAAAGSDVGKQAEGYMRSGALVPDDLVTKIMLAAVARLGPQDGFILDGYPRTVPQAEALDAGLTRSGQTVNAVLYFELSDEEIVARVAGRRVCEKCGATYNLQFFPLRIAGKCDKCGGNVVQREDDREDVVRARLVTYRRQTSPLVGYYRGRGLLHAIDAARNADEVEAEIQDVLRPLS